MESTHPQMAGDSRQYSLLGKAVALSAADAGMPWLDRLDLLLAGFRAANPAGSPVAEIAVRLGLDGALWQIAQDDTLTPAYSDNALLREVERRAFAEAAKHAPLSLVLHAGAVVREGVALLLPAASGAGKSTLTLALARHGWLPLTDDICPLARAGDAWVALPCPRCCHLSIAAVEVLQAAGIALEGPVADLAGYYRPPKWSTPSRVRAIVVPRFAPGAPPRAARLTQAECLAALISASFDQVSQPGSARRAAARHLAARAPGFSLTYASVDAALHLVDTVADGLSHQAAADAGVASARVAYPA